MTRTFKIEYTDPKTGELVMVIRVFEDTSSLTAYEWAEDCAYSLADKGPFTVTLVP